MLRSTAIRTQRQHKLGCTWLVAAAALFMPALAHAHFVLVTPDAWMSQDGLGLPEKLGPCGDEGGGTPTGKVTAFRAGQTIAVTIDEVIMHPGHYRVALAVNDRSELPAEPMVTPIGNDPCGSAAIDDPPTFPILADNVLPHTQAFAAPQTFSVTLPTDITCTKCTLQVLEFMSNHGAPCFYHHCADISIQPALATASQTASPTATPSQTPSSTAEQTPTSMQTVSASESPTPTPTPATTPPACVGDCDGSGDVTVDEIVTMVNIALGNAPISACPAAVAWDTGCGADTACISITINPIIEAVNHALHGCGG